MPRLLTTCISHAKTCLPRRSHSSSARSAAETHLCVPADLGHGHKLPSERQARLLKLRQRSYQGPLQGPPSPADRQPFSITPEVSHGSGHPGCDRSCTLTSPGIQGWVGRKVLRYVSPAAADVSRRDRIIALCLFTTSSCSAKACPACLSTQINNTVCGNAPWMLRSQHCLCGWKTEQWHDSPSKSAAQPPAHMRAV